MGLPTSNCYYRLFYRNQISNAVPVWNVNGPNHFQPNSTLVHFRVNNSRPSLTTPPQVDFESSIGPFYNKQLEAFSLLSYFHDFSLKLPFIKILGVPIVYSYFSFNNKLNIYLLIRHSNVNEFYSHSHSITYQTRHGWFIACMFYS